MAEVKGTASDHVSAADLSESGTELSMESRALLAVARCGLAPKPSAILRVRERIAMEVLTEIETVKGQQ